MFACTLLAVVGNIVVVATHLWGKFKMLVLGDDPPMIFYPGNAGSGDGPAKSSAGDTTARGGGAS